MAFCKDFNQRTQEAAGSILPTIITVYSDKTFSFETREPPVPELIKKIVGIESGSKVPNRDKVGKMTDAQVEEIANRKAKDMRAGSLEAAKQMVRGTARSMGVDIV
jgi:large subunit ribosomal protein L11